MIFVTVEDFVAFASVLKKSGLSSTKVIGPDVSAKGIRGYLLDFSQNMTQAAIDHVTWHHCKLILIFLLFSSILLVHSLSLYLSLSSPMSVYFLVEHDTGRY